jgi:hypothetical protein
VEQRIGRIDRIGQARPVVAVANLYLENSIEQDAYHILRQRIGFFEEVVGPLQPILAEMPRILRKVAQGEMERAEALQEMNQIARAQRMPLQDLEQFVSPEANSGEAPFAPSPPVSQAELSAWCLAHPAVGMRVTAVPEPGSELPPVEGQGACYELCWPDAPGYLGIDPENPVLITFDPLLADRHPPTGPQEDEAGGDRPATEGVRLLTWGEPLLTAWLSSLLGERLTLSELEELGVRREADSYVRVDSGQPITFQDVSAAAVERLR